MIAATGLPSARRLIAKERGFSLLEVLVALIIFSIGMLGIASLQANVLRLNYGSYQRTQAIFLAYDVMDRLRANREVALVGDCDTSGTQLTGVCAIYINDWLDMVGDYLPDGTGTIDCDTTSSGCEVEIGWNVSRQGGTVTGTASNTASFSAFASI